MTFVRSHPWWTALFVVVAFFVIGFAMFGVGTEQAGTRADFERVDGG